MIPGDLVTVSAVWKDAVRRIVFENKATRELTQRKYSIGVIIREAFVTYDPIDGSGWVVLWSDGCLSAFTEASLKIVQGIDDPDVEFDKRTFACFWKDK